MRSRSMPRVVHHDVEAAEGGDRSVHHELREARVRDGVGIGDRVAACRKDFLDDSLRQ